ncbi:MULTISPECIES: Na+/H+ antiporter NhaA [unclassified Saccharopolyspora]|uniref:Na+/H+ antiporter NhaA n=1 Tax=unclassified Saccharopolyspora TaxID=2646250 RepID=UPI001CD25025|nr:MULTISPECIES: Na+/H+ antiporter NhaA [unclassified Saccharopolyspora]MCA1184913.1 Na+/H+ antiporter NhaA [Saccharopolyspora sp. 6T]MCA1279921.1 Na+/H+ antiporter NhaA [Saccharopolyspora sp. 7B]
MRRDHRDGCTLTMPRFYRQRRALLRALDSEPLAAAALAAATLIALVWANLGSGYDDFWSTEAGVRIGGLDLSMSASDWVDDAVMAVFFFSVGLDVRREFTLGELRDRRRAVLPVCAALGGLVVPVLLFLALNAGSAAAPAWGVVISTDTAFALGMLALVGPRKAPRLRVFLLTLAVVDDIGALGVIALFYTDDLSPGWLAVAAAGLVLIWLLQRFRIWRVMPYLVVGMGVWLAMHLSGVHPTLAGVLIALLMPVYPTRLEDVDTASKVVHQFRQAPAARVARLARWSIDRSVPMNQRLTDLLQSYVNFLVVPLFALSNAGVPLSGQALSAALSSRLTWGVVAGLVLGKFLGIAGTSTLVRRLVPGTRAPSLDVPRLAGVGALSGMGFTISLLVVDLALSDPALRDEARVGVLLASALALGLSWAVFAAGNRLRPLPAPAGRTLQREVDPERDHIRGPVDARTTIVVYAALDHRYRTRTFEVENEVRHLLGDEFRLVFRHHVTAQPDFVRALAIEAAGAQDRFWEMHDAISEQRGEPDARLLRGIAADLGLDVERFVHDVRTYAHLGRIEDDNLDADTASLPDQAVFYVDGHKLEGPANSWNITRTARLSR